MTDRHARVRATTRSRRRALRLVTAGVVAVAVGAAVPAAAGAAPIDTTHGTTPARTFTKAPNADPRISQLLTARATTSRFGSAFSGAVVDAASGKVVWTRNGNTGLMPASTTKLVTATDALAVFGSGHRFTTRVKRGTAADQVYLVGSGDPAFSSSQLTALAKTTAAAMKAAGRTTVRVYADDSLFPAPTLATGWRSTYIPADTTWLRALDVDGRQNADTSIDAAKLFAGKLKTYGLTVSSVARGKVASNAPVLASSAGQTVGQIISTMMLNSDNEHAESLHRLVGIQLGYGNTWSAARSAQSYRMAQEGLSISALYDGSGLSRSDRLTSLQLARIVSNVFEPANATRLGLLRSDAGLPIAGRTGTLQAAYGRFTAPTSSCAAGLVHAKTGTLTDAATLAGWVVGTDGRVKTFAFVVNGLKVTTTLKQDIDMLAATVAGCY
jgi:D-alanyl-D-alanine carboxypeptidase/D-alanyl-D-alanine-endopeptidase (penicillin-binding protein 4)